MKRLVSRCQIDDVSKRHLVIRLLDINNESGDLKVVECFSLASELWSTTIFPVCCESISLKVTFSSFFFTLRQCRIPLKVFDLYVIGTPLENNEISYRSKGWQLSRTATYYPLQERGWKRLLDVRIQSLNIHYSWFLSERKWNGQKFCIWTYHLLWECNRKSQRDILKTMQSTRNSSNFCKISCGTPARYFETKAV